MIDPAKILVIDDDKQLREQIVGVLEDEGYQADGVRTAEDGLAFLSRNECSLVITDLVLPGDSGLSVVARAAVKETFCPVLVITARASVGTAVEAMRRGACHYLNKPFPLDVLLAEVAKALEQRQVLLERRRLRDRLAEYYGADRLLGRSRSMQSVRSVIERYARTDSTVLIVGETGTGKELVADALHTLGERAGGPMVKVNCGAVAPTLLESEIFGHEKGAFTGAARRHAGRFERADGGTLFLDEITEMNASLQTKLLRVLQDGVIERVGSNSPVHTDVRVIAATNRNPEEAMAEGNLCRDLYYRLNVLRIDIPPLRERKEDVQVLIDHFLPRYCARHGKVIYGVSDRALAALERHRWPGNVRELENCIERAILLAEHDLILPYDLPPHPRWPVKHGDKCPTISAYLRSSRSGEDYHSQGAGKDPVEQGCRRPEAGDLSVVSLQEDETLRDPIAAHRSSLSLMSEQRRSRNSASVSDTIHRLAPFIFSRLLRKFHTR